MDMIGLTPVDSILSISGLGFAYAIGEYLFIHTKIGLLSFLIGFLWSLWQSIVKEDFTFFLSLIFLSIAGSILFVFPYTLSTGMKSAREVFGHSNTIATPIREEMGGNEIKIPTILSFVGQMADYVNIGLIRGMDHIIGAGYKFLDDPFGTQKLSIEAHFITHSPLADPYLQEDFQDFLYAHYWPSLLIYNNEKKHINDSSLPLWPGHEAILDYYSDGEKSKWEELEQRIKHFFADPKGVWFRLKNHFRQMGFSMDQVDEQLMASLVQLHEGKRTVCWEAMGMLISGYFYLCGWANFCIYSIFPLLMVIMVIVREHSIFLRYTEIFLWVKSLYLVGAIAHYVSIIAMHIQAGSQTQLNWFWDYPYFTVIAALILILMTVLSWFWIYRCLDFKN